MIRSLRDFAVALGSTVLGTAQALHDVFLVREQCGAVSDFHDDGDPITCDRHAGHRGGHRSAEYGLGVEEFSSWSDHGYDGPRCLR